MKCPVREDEQEPGVPSLDQEDPRGGSGSPLKSSCLENPMDRGARWGYSPWGRKESDTTERLNNSSTKQNEGARTSKAPTGQPGAQACAAGAAATVLKLPKAEVSIGSCRLPDYMLEYTNFITIFYVTGMLKIWELANSKSKFQFTDSRQKHRISTLSVSQTRTRCAVWKITVGLH